MPMEHNTFSNTFYKLDKLWTRKRKHFNYERAIFDDDGIPSNFIPKIIQEQLRETHLDSGNIFRYFMNRYSTITKFVFQEQAMYIYDHRQSDYLPKNNAELQKLSDFLHMCIYPLFPRETQKRLKKYHMISCCFVIWFFGTPNFFVSTCLLPTRPTKAKHKVMKQEHNLYKSSCFSQDKQIPQLQASVHCALSVLETQLGVSLEKLNAHDIHPTISAHLTEEKLGKNKYKRMLKHYQQYQKTKQKLDHLVRTSQFKQNEKGVHRSNGTFIPFKQQCIEKEELSEDGDDVVTAPQPPPAPPVLAIPDSWEDLDDDSEDAEWV